MESSKFWLIMLVLIAITITKLEAKEDNNASDFHFLPKKEPSLRVTNNRFLAQNLPPPPMTCDIFPRVCANNDSPGPDCCNKQCVDVMADEFNCGMCRRKCRYAEICCRGECVNPSVDERNCGRCNNRCKNGGSCAYGMCSYA